MYISEKKNMSNHSNVKNTMRCCVKRAYQVADVLLELGHDGRRVLVLGRLEPPRHPSSFLTFGLDNLAGA